MTIPMMINFEAKTPEEVLALLAQKMGKENSNLVLCDVSLDNMQGVFQTSDYEVVKQDAALLIYRGGK